jgi:hypothetical protein
MQESNQRLENNFLNEQNANFAGLKARVGTGVKNIFTKSENDASPRIEAAFARVTAKGNQLRKELAEFKSEYQKLYTDRKVFLDNAVKKLQAKGKPNAGKVQQRLTLLDQNFNNIQAKIAELDKVIYDAFYTQKALLVPNPDESTEGGATEGGAAEGGATEGGAAEGGATEIQ